LSQYDTAQMPMRMGGNVFLKGAKPCRQEDKALLLPETMPNLKLTEEADGWYLEMASDPAVSAERTRQLVTTKLLGSAAIPNVPFEQRDGAPVRINTDYFGNRRNKSNPYPGPFERSGQGEVKIKVWDVVGSH
jgi:alpha-N-arabinofuranosidase